MELLGKRESERGEHGHASVLEFHLAVKAHLALGDSLVGVGSKEACGVEVSQGIGDTGEGLCKFDRVEWLGGHLWRRNTWSERSGSVCKGEGHFGTGV